MTRAWVIPLIGLSVALPGCGLGPETVWSTRAVSPDGRWIAEARTQMWSGRIDPSGTVAADSLDGAARGQPAHVLG